MIEVRSYNVLNGNVTFQKYPRVRKFKDKEELEQERKKLEDRHKTDEYPVQIAFIYIEKD